MATITLFAFIANENQLFAQEWIELGSGINALNPNNSIWTLCADTGGIVYAAGGFTDSVSINKGNFYVAKWDPNLMKWSEVGIGLNSLHANGSISTIFLDNKHYLYAAGSFTDSNGYEYVAKWDGITWTEIGIGENALKANASINTIFVDTIGNIYAGGEFTNGSNSSDGYPYVSKWNGIFWQELGESSDNRISSNNHILSIKLDSKMNVYVSGDIWDTVFGNYFVGKYDGIAWSKLGIGYYSLNANGPIWDICLDDSDNVYAGGFFTNTSGIYYVAKWNDTSWSEVGSSTYFPNPNIPILSICSWNEQIYINQGLDDNGKEFVEAYQGNSWSELGVGENSLNANCTIYSICNDLEGNIYAAGCFTDSSSSTYGSSYVAKYKNINAGINKLITCDNNIYPNPFMDKIYLNVDISNISKEYEIYDLIGNIVKSGKITELNTVIDLSELNQSLYLFKLNNEYTKIIKK